MSLWRLGTSRYVRFPCRDPDFRLWLNAKLTLTYSIRRVNIHGIHERGGVPRSSPERTSEWRVLSLPFSRWDAILSTRLLMRSCCISLIVFFFCQTILLLLCLFFLLLVIVMRTRISTPTPTTEPPVLYGIFWGLRKADLSVPPQKICHTGAVVLGVGGEILVVKWGDGWHGKAARKARRLDRPPPAARVCCYLIVLLLVLLLLLLLMIMMKVAIILNNNNNNHNNNTYYYH